MGRLEHVRCVERNVYVIGNLIYCHVLCNFACYVDARECWAASCTTKWCTRLHVSKRINTDLWFVWYCCYHFLQLLLSAIIIKGQIVFRYLKLMLVTFIPVTWIRLFGEHWCDTYIYRRIISIYAHWYGAKTLLHIAARIRPELSNIS